MEMYTNAPDVQRQVRVAFGPTAAVSNIDAYVYKGDKELFEFQTVAVEPDVGFYVTLPVFLNQYDGELSVYWSITYTEPANGEIYTINKATPVSLVTPLLTPTEIRGVWESASDTEVVRIEKAVRHIVQAYTGQEFGHFIGDYSVKSIGGKSLRLPRRLMEIDTFDGHLAVKSQYVIADGGYTLTYYPYGVPPVKADYYGLHMHTGGVIHNPNNVRWQEFSNGHTYVIGGNWGWEAVPEPVKEAAKLLVNDYACADSQYRDRYLTSMTAADWRIQFNSGAFLRTGNVRADQLLSEYVTTRGWGVI